MNIHLPAILMFTRGTRFWHTAIWLLIWSYFRLVNYDHLRWVTTTVVHKTK
jgi:hypothetical protein